MNEDKGWQSGEELLHAALTHEPGERMAFVRDACEGNDELRIAVESLLLAHQMAETAAEQQWPHRFTENATADAQLPTSIGPYRLLEKIGQGGMGQVWLAEQTAPVQRRVALKLIRAGSHDPAHLRRFQSERQSLAMMDHPAIAKIFEAGSAPNGQPYLVMEYVHGLPITVYCDEKKVSIRDRLELFVKVCEGVQHAHQKAVIHRDLKPANILVAEVDGKPLPRIIDFGLAKATRSIGQPALTQEGGASGTPGYMSPEQADPGAEDVDTRTDVYSLGVVLYELLTGSLPFEVEKWRKLPLHEALRQLREEDPPRPSARARQQEDGSPSRAAARGVEPRQLPKLLEGDLDSIALKAIEKDRARRYGTPSELAADVGRYRKHEAVVARPATSGYRLQRYVRRHVVGVATASGLVLLLVIFAALQAMQLRRITRERDRADRVTEFMAGMFKVSDPSETRGNTITAREILDKASKGINSGLSKEPELQARMMQAMSVVYYNLGLYGQAEALVTRAVESYRHDPGMDDPRTLRAMTGLGWILSSRGKLDEADKLLRESLERQRRVMGAEHPDTLTTMMDLGGNLIRQGRYRDAEVLQRDTLDIKRRVLGGEHPDTISTLGNLAVTLDYEGKVIDAEKSYREVFDMRRRVLGPDHPHTLAAMVNVGQILSTNGRYAEAEKLLREAIDIHRRIMGPEHPQTLASIGNLASTLASQGRYAEVEQLQRQAVDVARRTLGPEHADTLRYTQSLALTLGSEHRYPAAEGLLTQVLETQRRALGPEHSETLSTMTSLSNNLRRQQRYVEAEKLLREALDIQRRTLGAEHRETLTSMSSLASLFLDQHRYRDAEALHLQALDIRLRTLGPDHPNTASSRYDLACVEALVGDRDRALQLLSEAVDHGLAPVDDIGMETDADLKSLHDDPRFSALVTHAREVASAQKTR